jgi:hypothetical protein
VSRERRQRQQRKTGKKGKWFEPRKHGRHGSEDGAYAGDDCRNSHHGAEARRERSIVRDARHADEDEQKRAEHQPDGNRSHHETEERGARRRQEAREEEQTRDDVLRGRPVVSGECSLRRRPTRAHAERDHPRELVPVVREDPPQHRVVAVGEAGPERDHERATPGDPRLPGEHRPSPVPDRFDPGREPNVIVEDDADPGRCGLEHRPIPRDGPEEPGMRPGSLGEGQGADQDDKKCGPTRQRFKKPSGAHC